MHLGFRPRLKARPSLVDLLVRGESHGGQQQAEADGDGDIDGQVIAGEDGQATGSTDSGDRGGTLQDDARAPAHAAAASSPPPPRAGSPLFLVALNGDAPVPLSASSTPEHHQQHLDHWKLQVPQLLAANLPLPPSPVPTASSSPLPPPPSISLCLPPPITGPANPTETPDLVLSNPSPAAPPSPAPSTAAPAPIASLKMAPVRWLDMPPPRDDDPLTRG